MSYELIYRSGYEGHHLYRDTSNGQVVIADHSNDDECGESGGPEGTDDGVLYVDFTRPVTLHWGTSTPDVYAIPVIGDRARKGLCVLGSLAEVHRIEVLEKRRFS